MSNVTGGIILDATRCQMLCGKRSWWEIHNSEWLKVLPGGVCATRNPPEVVWEAVLAGNMGDRSILHKLCCRMLLQHALTCRSWSLLQRLLSIGIFYKWGN